MDLKRLNPAWKEWEIVEKIGEGAYGKVYKAMRVHHGVTSYAAIKAISIPQNPSEIASIRSNGLTEEAAKSYFEGVVMDFVKEIRLMVSLKGAPNIVNIEDYEVIEKEDEIGWDIYIRMELLTSLNDYIEKHPMKSKDIIKLGQDVCSALELCSKKNIIHRDIKPENIFVSEYGDFKVGDFGIARELEKTSGALSTKGTYNYMAPEIVVKDNDLTVNVYSGRRYDCTVDVYSLGLVLYKLLNNNRLPFLDPNASFIKHQEISEAIERRFSGEPIPAPVATNKALVEVILKACAFKPNQRYQNAREMKEALEQTKHTNRSDKKQKIKSDGDQGEGSGEGQKNTNRRRENEKNCLGCNRSHDASYRICPHCGYGGKAKGSPGAINKKLLFIIAAIFLGGLAIVMITSAVLNRSNEDSELNLYNNDNGIVAEEPVEDGGASEEPEEGRIVDQEPMAEVEVEELIPSEDEVTLSGTWVGTFVSDDSGLAYGLEIVINEDYQIVASYFSDVARMNYIGLYRGFARFGENNSIEIIYTDATQRPTGWVAEGAIFIGVMSADILIGHFEIGNNRTGEAMLTRGTVIAEPNVVRQPFDFNVWGNTSMVQINNNGIVLNVPIPSREDLRQSVEQFLLFGGNDEAGWWYRVDARIGYDNSIADAINRYLRWIANRECTLEMDYNIYNLERTQLAVIDVFRARSDAEPWANSTYVLAFEHEGEVVVVHVNFAGNFNDARKRPFLEAYGIERFIRAGIL